MFSALILSIIIFASETVFFNQRLIPDVNILYFSKGIIKTGYYFISYLICLLGISLFLCTKNRIIFVTGIIFILISYLLILSYKFINGHGFGLSELQTLVHESNKFTNDVWHSYSELIIKSVIIVLFISLIIWYIRNNIIRYKLLIPNKIAVVALFLSCLPAYSVVYLTANTHIKYPVPINMLTTLVYYFTSAPYHGERNTVSIGVEEKSKYDNIIWIIDESIGGKYLSINGYDHETTPYLNSIKDKYVNLGLASSGSNCSASSNLILMSGIQLNQLPDKDFYSLKTPNIFQYAKHAGYRTHYISGQSNDDVLQNHMTPSDLEYIDGFYQPSLALKNNGIPENDLIIQTEEALNSGLRNFIYIVKRGAHFHWEGKYPKQKTFFKPTLKADDNLTATNKDKSINSYLNAIKFTVDDFFKEFFAKTKLLDSKNSLIIYTSDHGQSILEGTSNGTHCDGYKPNLTQGIVPLLIFGDEMNNNFTQTQKSQYSHFQIFPTTLKLMGYSRFNGSTMMEPNGDNQSFFSGDIFGRTSTFKSSIKNAL